VFNIDYDVFQVSRRAVAYQAVAATLIPALAALWPVLSGAAITVREAIASYGLGGDFGSNRLDRTIERLGAQLLSSPYAISLGNMFRRKGRLILTQLVLVGAGTMFLIVMSLSSSITHTLDTDLNRRGFDIRLGFDDPQHENRVLSMLRTVPEVAGAELWYVAPAAILKEGQRLKEAGVGAQVVGVPADSTYYKPLIVAGRWFEPGDGRVLVISKDTADDNNLKVGEDISKSWKFAVAAEEPTVQIATNGGFTGSFRGNLPDFTGFLRYHTRRLQVHFGGVARSLRFDGTGSTPDDTTLGWGVNSAFKAATWDKDHVMGQFAFGSGISRYIESMSGQNVDALFGAGNQLVAVPARSAVFGYERHWNSILMSAFAYSISDLSRNSGFGGSVIKRTQDARVNLIYTPFRLVDLGVEYMWGRRDNQDGTRGEASRLQFSTIYRFN
jgi:hypothetical protein